MGGFELDSALVQSPKREQYGEQSLTGAESQEAGVLIVTGINTSHIELLKITCLKILLFLQVRL